MRGECTLWDPGPPLLVSFMIPSVHWCPQPSAASRVSYTVSPEGGLSVELGCLWLTIAHRMGLEGTSIWRVWGRQGPDATIKFDLLIHLQLFQACTLKTPEREASPGSHTGQAVGCVSHLFTDLSVLLTTHSLLASCHWHMDIWSACVHPFSISSFWRSCLEFSPNTFNLPRYRLSDKFENH